jgi:septal ring factor EnvC (AmiA/AmiB activator)
VGKDFVLPIITLLLGGGLSAAILNLVRAKNESQKAPADRDAVIVTSAESAVVIMQKVLDATNQQLGRKEQELSEVTATLVRVKGELRELRDRCSELEELLSIINTEQEAHKKHV